MAQLLNNLPVGAKVKFGKHKIGNEAAWSIVWRIVAKSHPGYPTDSVTLLTDKIIDTKAFDVAEPGNTEANRKSFGNNDYKVSNIDQWLGSNKSSWYTSAHVYDMPPSYESKPGFLYNFTEAEQKAILTTTIRVVLPLVYGSQYEDIERKVFIPSSYETARNSVTQLGTVFEWFEANPSRSCTIQTQAYSYLPTANKPATVTEGWAWYTRTPVPDSAHTIFGYNAEGGNDSLYAYGEGGGIRPALNLSSTMRVSDTTDSDGCYTFVYNTAPPRPAKIVLPSKVLGGKANTIAWSSVVDADGDAVTYQLECSYDSGSTYTTIYSGNAISYAHIVTYGKSTIKYRVKAIDAWGESGEYIGSAIVNIVNNTAPVIDGSDSNLGVKSEGFSGTYKVTDANNDTVTVTESIDGVQIRSLIATLGTSISYDIKGNTWLALPNGSHTLTIRATDGIDSSVRTYTFIKLVDSFTIRNSTPWASATMPTRIMLVITRNLPAEATFKVEVCNNGNDTSPNWEDATDAVRSGLVHVFANKAKTAGTWGVVVRVTVNRNGSTGACYVSAIGGNFE